MTSEMVVAFDNWLAISIEAQLTEPMGYLERCATALITEWRIKKVHPHTHYYTSNKISFNLDVPLSMALIEFIRCYPIRFTDQLGNGLRQIANEIDQHFQYLFK